MNIKSLLTEEVVSILTEESLQAIEEAFNQRVDNAVKTAVDKLDEEHSLKLESLLNDLDKDRTEKMLKLVESIDKTNASKLLKVVKFYERNQVADAKKFKKQLVESIDRFLGEYLEESISKEDFEAAVKNKTAFRVLDNLRQVLAVNSAMVEESFQKAVESDKEKLQSLQKENVMLKKNFKLLYEQNKENEKEVFLESKMTKFSDEKKSFIRKVLGEKDIEFIKENFDYTLRIFDKKEKEQLKTLKESALENRKVKPDVVILEKNNKKSLNNNVEQSDIFVQELEKMWGNSSLV